MRISTTLIEQYRKYREEQFVTEPELIASIKGVFVPSRFMKLGTAFHSILEAPWDCILPDGNYESGGFQFSEAVVAPCLEIFNPAGVFEVKHTKEYTIHGQPVTVVAKVDQLLARRVIENKTKWSTFDFDTYFESFQWRYYADVFGADVVTYNVFCLTENAAKEIKLSSIETFNLFPYAKMHGECVSLLCELVEFVRIRGLESYLKDKVAA